MQTTVNSYELDGTLGTQTTFFCSRSIDDFILQHMKARLPPGITSTTKQTFTVNYRTHHLQPSTPTLSANYNTQHLL